MGTIIDFFETGFPEALSLDHNVAIQASIYGQPVGPQVEFRTRRHLSLGANALFLSVLLPELPEAEVLELVRNILTKPEGLIVPMSSTKVVLPGAATPGFKVGFVNDSQLRVRLGGPDGLDVEDIEFPFTRRIYFYFQQVLSEEARAQIQLDSRGMGISAGVRDTAYALEASKQIMIRAFISHAHSDKEVIARPLAGKLMTSQIGIWYDEYALKVGDSLRESIETGLKTAPFCILILSPNFLSKGGWTKREFDSVFTRELIEDRRVILPVWCGVEKKDVYEYSPSLADRVALDWKMGVDEVASRLIGRLLEWKDEQVKALP